MSRYDWRAILEVELLEERCAAASVVPTAVVGHGHTSFLTSPAITAELALQQPVTRDEPPTQMAMPFGFLTPTAVADFSPAVTAEETTETIVNDDTSATPYSAPLETTSPALATVREGEAPDLFFAPNGPLNPTALAVMGEISSTLYLARVTPPTPNVPSVPTSSAISITNPSFTPEDVPVLTPYETEPLGAGFQQLNNTVPNAAEVQSAMGGFRSLSPFLPAYYPKYTQVGPFYTGSDVESPEKSTSESTSTEPQGMLSPSLDQVFALWAMQLPWWSAV